MDFNKTASEIVKNIGGEENVVNLSHCMTRLRFVMKDESKVNKDAVEQIDGVLGSTFGAGQYQIIMGQNLAPAFDALTKNYSFSGEGEVKKEKQPLTLKGAFMEVVNYMSGSVSPVITGLMAGGLLKLVLYLLTLVNPEVTAFSTYTLINILADVPFYFMPILVAFGASRKLGCSPVLPIILASMLIAPNFMALEGPVSVFGLNVPILKYSSTAIPAMLSTLAVYWFEKFFNKVIPGLLKNTLVPSLTLLASFVLTFVVLAPLGTYVGNGVVNAIAALQNIANPLALAVFTAILPFMIMAGVHTLVAPFMLENINTLGYDPLFRPGLLLQLLAEGGAAFGIAARMKEKEKRADAITMGVSAVFAGITEPAIYGINLKYKSGLIGALCGAVAGGLFGGFFNIRNYVITKNTILALPVFQDTMIPAAIACLITFAVAFAVTYILYKDNSVKPENVKAEVQHIADGRVIDITEVNDETFSKKMMGDGIAYIPETGVIRAPFDGTITVAFPTGHAFGITRKDGVEALIHIGIDTVNLEGKGFDVKVKQGDTVKAGQTLVNVDLNTIREAGLDTATMLVITNLNGKELAINKDNKDYAAVIR